MFTFVFKLFFMLDYWVSCLRPSFHKKHILEAQIQNAHCFDSAILW